MDVIKHEYTNSKFYNSDSKLTEKQVFLLKNILLENNYIISQFGFEDIIYVDNLSLHRIIDFINYNKPISNNAIKLQTN